ncbi:MAG: hypothetical protein J5U17_08375 [Candidatus Methanoperedens sp.]|nr:hypothetical protein [Candidatus Methanoperedens sp.]MCE8428401.1 hypothetical protein [Candidatus Methanoperedens sp.]
MLGEMIGEFWGKVTSQRVLPSDGPDPSIETSVQQRGKLLGVDTTDNVTYWSVMRAGGGLYGEANGIQMTDEGNALTYTAQGAGRFTGIGTAVSFRGSLFFQTNSKKLEHLGNVAVIFEFELDENGNTHATLWEWK